MLIVDVGIDDFPYAKSETEMSSWWNEVDDVTDDEAPRLRTCGLELLCSFGTDHLP
jgi:hypothetical protein